MKKRWFRKKKAPHDGWNVFFLIAMPAILVYAVWLRLTGQFECKLDWNPMDDEL